MGRPYWVVDVFTDQRFAGNPAAVLLDHEGLSDSRMQAIAGEFNLSETTFVLPAAAVDQFGQTESQVESPGNGRDKKVERVRFRWFTPTLEASMCGHATIAGVHALVESGRLRGVNGQACSLLIETRSGLLTAFVETLPNRPEKRLIWLELRPPVLIDQPMDRGVLAAALRIDKEATRGDLPTVRTQDDDLLLFVDRVITVHAARPDFGRLAELLTSSRLRGLSLATSNTLSSSISIQSRFFAPPAGVNEDPVTGSVHGPLAAYAVQHGLVPIQGGTAGMMCVQGIPGGRCGVVYALVETASTGSYAVRIGGHAVTTMHGSIET